MTLVDGGKIEVGDMAQAGGSPGDPVVARAGRREVLKGLVAVGALGTPTVVSSWRVAAGATSPGQVCYAVKLDPECDGFNPNNNNFTCFDAADLAGLEDPCDTPKEPSVVVEVDGGDTWEVTLPTGCEFVEGYAKCSNDLCRPVDPDDDVGVNASGQQVITFRPCRVECDGPGGPDDDCGEDDSLRDVSHVELIFCC